jgi:hypothetical protein
MKKIFKPLAILSVFGAALAGCAPEEITFSHENPAFEAKEGMILIEAIAPTGIVAGDEIYIIGPAIGDSASVVGVKPEYQLEQSTEISRKWGVYLDPTRFLDGKTLADGFRFVAVDKGHEVTPLNKEPEHTLNAQTGKSYNVYMAGAWSNDFIVQPLVDLPEHLNFRVYILDNSGWDDVCLYIYGDKNDLGGAWPGISVTGTEEIGGKEYKYFEVGPEANQLAEHLIFNNAGNGAQTPGDQEPVITFENADYFFSITADGCTALKNPGMDRKAELGEIPEPEPVYPTPGYKMYVQDETSWPGNLFVHLWTDGYSTEWPGLAVSSTEEIDGVTYKVFDLPGEVNGKSISFIAHSDQNDGENRQQVENVSIDGSVAYKITASSAEAVTAPADPVRIFLTDERHWPGNLYIHMWNDGGVSTEWPGISGEMVNFNGTNYLMFTAPRNLSGQTVSAIIHSDENDGENRIETTMKLDKDRFYLLGTQTIFDEALEYNPSSIYVRDEMGWGENLHLYAWGTSEIFGGWAGASPNATVRMGGYKWYRFDIAAADAHKEAHLIFNNGNGGDGNQFDSDVIETGEDHWYRIADFKSEALPAPKARIFVVNNTGWADADLHLYSWGTYEAFGGWPGSVSGGKQTVDGKEYLYFEIPESGIEMNLIFNNGNGGDGNQFDAAKVIAGEDLFYTLTPGTATPIE